MRMRGTLDAVGVPPTEGLGFCYGPAPQPRDGEGEVTCEPVGGPDPSPGPFELVVPERTPGETIHIAPFAVVDGLPVYFTDRTISVLPGQVGDVQAINVTPLGAELQWSPVPGAVAYRIFRDGVEVAEVPGAPWAIVGLPEPPRAVPQNVTASNNHPTRIAVEWDALPAPTAGASREFEVAAVAPNEVEGPRSTPMSVARSAYTPLEVVVERVQDGVPAQLPLDPEVTYFEDLSAPAPTLNAPPMPTATQGTLLGEVEVAGAVLAPSPGAPVTYRVRRVYVEGGAMGDYSAPADGWRALSTVTLRLLAGPSAGDTPDELVNEPTSVGLFVEGELLWIPRDTRPTPVETRWYRYEVSAPGLAPVLSPATSGIPGAVPSVTLATATPSSVGPSIALSGMLAAFAPVPASLTPCWRLEGESEFSCGGATEAGPGAVLRTATGLQPGRRYDVRLEATNMHGTGQSNIISSLLLVPSAPTGVAASTTFEDFVRVTWDSHSPQEVDEFRIYRMGDFVGTAPAAATSWDHTEAAAGSVAAPTGFSATGSPYWVDLAWTGAASSPGPSRLYTVRAVNATGTSDPSTGANGQRAAPTITGYRVAWTGGHTGEVDLGAGATSHQDLAAPGVTRGTGSLAASDGTFIEFVRLTISGFAITPAPTVNYTVRALTASGPGPTAATSGSRTHNGNTFNYEVSTDGGMTWTSLSFADPNTTYDDEDAPSDGTSQSYRAAVFTDGIPGWEYTNTAVGARGVPVVWTAFDSGQFHVCAVASNGRAYCWGDYWDFNANGILGSSGSAAGSPRQVAGGYTDWFDIGCNELHCCGLRGSPATGGSAWCWGSNASSRLGRSGGGSNAPVPVIDSPTDLVTIAAANANTCAVRSNGQLWCWGTGTGTCSSTVAAQCDPSNTYTAVAGGRVSSMMARRSNGVWIGWGSNSMYGLLRTDAAGQGIGALGGGHDYDHIIGSRDQNNYCGIVGTTMHCWGRNHHFQTHHPTKSDWVTQFQSEPYTLPEAWSAMGCGGDACCGWHIASDQLRCWGLNLNGQLGLTPGSPFERRAIEHMPTYTGAPIVSVRGGRLFLCALDEDGDIWCWGSNGAGTRANGTSGGNFQSPNRITPP